MKRYTMIAYQYRLTLMIINSSGECVSREFSILLFIVHLHDCLVMSNISIVLYRVRALEIKYFYKYFTWKRVTIGSLKYVHIRESL